MRNGHLALVRDDAAPPPAAAPQSHRVAVFTADPGHTVRKAIVAIDRSIPGLSWLVVHHRPLRTRRQILKNQWTMLKRNGWRWIPYQLANVWRRLTVRQPPAEIEKGFPGADYTTASLLRQPNVRLVQVRSIHAPETLAMIRDFAPDLGLAISAPILKPSVFTIPRLGSLTLHKGKAPDYRGMPPAFWELWNGETEVGCTIQVVAEKLDAGDVVRRGTVARAPFATVRGVTLPLDELGVRLLRESVAEFLSGTQRPEPQSGHGKTYTKPTLSQVSELRGRLLGLAPAARRSGPALLLREAAHRATRTAWQVGLRHVTTPRITVLLYHRVSDDARDDLTIGVEQFERQMDLLRRHCRILSIDEVLNASVITPSDRPQVAVTFDDGYLDNFQHAAPVLERHGIPAAFFVTTGLIGTEGRFPHDVRRDNPQIPLMSWDHLREMRRMGFEIGSHSVSHVDCVAEPLEKVRDELVRSRDDLQRELGVTAPVFAYPYGGRHQMNAERLALVRAAGYRGCLAAYGGSNVGTVDRFDVLRRGIHWEFSDEAFLAQCTGLR